MYIRIYSDYAYACPRTGHLYLHQGPYAFSLTKIESMVLMTPWCAFQPGLYSQSRKIHVTWRNGTNSIEELIIKGRVERLSTAKHMVRFGLICGSIFAPEPGLDCIACSPWVPWDRQSGLGATTGPEQAAVIIFVICPGVNFIC